MSQLRREQRLSTLSRQSSYLRLHQRNSQQLSFPFSVIQQPQTLFNELFSRQTPKCFTQPPLPQLLFCSTTGCDGSGTEGSYCPTCKWIIRDHSQYKHISLSYGTQTQVQNTRHDPENEEAASLNQMRAEKQQVSPEAIEQVTSAERQPRTNKRNHEKTFHAHPQTKTEWQLQADDQHWGKVENQRQRQEFRFWYSQAKKVQALMEKEGWIDESEMWRTDDVRSEGQNDAGLFVKL